jgi:hypothetical protein
MLLLKPCWHRGSGSGEHSGSGSDYSMGDLLSDDSGDAWLESLRDDRRKDNTAVEVSAGGGAEPPEAPPAAVAEPVLAAARLADGEDGDIEGAAFGPRATGVTPSSLSQLLPPRGSLVLDAIRNKRYPRQT